MKRLIITLLTFFSIFNLCAQVGIGTTSPNGALDVNSSTQGLIIPRVSLSNVTISAPVIDPVSGGNPVTSTLVYNTNTSSVGTNSVFPGFYYWNGTKWVRLVSESSWLLNGNSNTNASINFLGTLDNNDLVFKRNNIHAGRLSETNTAFGFSSFKSNTSGNNNTAIGVSALEFNTTGFQNTAIGKSSLMLNSSGNYNVAIGYSSLERNTSGILNTAIGHSSLYNNLNGRSNVAIGKSSMERNISGMNNTAVGYNSLYNNQTGNDNIAVGEGAMERNINGGRNIAIGNASLYNNQTTSNCLSIGHDSQTANLSGQFNISLGNNSLSANQSGSNNIAIGYNSYNLGNYTNSIAIGNNAVITADNVVRIGNASTVSVGGFSNWTNVSDKRFKKNINYKNVPGLDFILKLKPVSYTLDQDVISTFLKIGKQPNVVSQQTGFIAQEVDVAAQEVGFDFSGVDKPKNSEDFYGLRYAEFVVPLTKAVQEQQERIDELQNEVAYLKQKIEEILSKK